MKAFHYADIQITLRPNSRYPLKKFDLLKSGVVESGLIAPQNLIASPPASEDLLALAHTQEYISAVRDNGLNEAALREMGFLWSRALYERGRRIVGCTLQAAAESLHTGIAFVLGGGAHHSHAGYGKGFCVFSDNVRL